MALPASLVRPGAEDQLNLVRAFSVTGKRRGKTRKIFVIKKISWLPSTNAAGKKIRRILISITILIVFVWFLDGAHIQMSIFLDRSVPGRGS